MNNKTFLGEWFDSNILLQYLPEIWMQIVAGITVLVVLYRLTSWLASYGISGVVGRALRASGKEHWIAPLKKYKVVHYISNAVPLFVIAGNFGLVPIEADHSEAISRFIAVAALIYLLLAVSGLMSGLQDIYSLTARGRTRSIKGYIEVARSCLWGVGLVAMISLVFNRSPFLMLSGLGAISAVLLLVFKDTLLSMVASAQMSSNDMLRIGDWIEMPQANADGFVIDIALHTIKIQNFDKTVTTVPTYKLFSESYKNWRHMFESGGRRIKRTLRIDAATVRFMTEAETDGLQRFALLHEYLAEKKNELEQSNRELGPLAKESVNLRRLSNIGTFRAYALRYLKQKKGVHQDMLMMVRMMEPGSEGVPIEIYCFSDDTAWVNYEQLQGDIFDHFLSILPEMGLRLYQAPSGSDLQSAFAHAAQLPQVLELEGVNIHPKPSSDAVDYDARGGPRA